MPTSLLGLSLHYILSLAVFLAIDLLWLGVIAKNYYHQQLGSLLSPNVNWAAALLFYALFVVGILYFAVRPADSAQQALWYGALFGFFTYMTYELTNYALIKGWPSGLVLVDIVWGVVLSGSVAYCSYLIAQALS